MATECPPPPLSVDVSQRYHSSSTDSSTTPSPTGIQLDSRPTTADSQPSLPSADSRPLSCLNVKFAPLPTLAPRKRRSTVPLGIAARGQLMRRQQQEYNTDGTAAAYQTSIWTDPEVLPVPPQAKTTSVTPSKSSEDESRSTLGKVVKGASKTLWRRVSNKRLRASEKSVSSDPASDLHPRSGSGMDSESVSSGPSAGEQTHVLATISGPNVVDNTVQVIEEEIRVWDERVGQTETMVEGQSKYSWASTLEIVVDPTIGRKAGWPTRRSLS